MKKLTISIVLGLVAGWLVSRMIDPPAPAVKTAAGRAGKGGAVLARFGPPSPLARSGRSLDEQRRESQRERGVFSPHRERLFSMDLVLSLSVEELVEAFRAGQLRDESEITAAFRRVAELDPVLGLALAGEIPGRNLHDRARSAVVDVWVKNDPKGMLAHLRSLDPSAQRAQLAQEFARSWAHEDPLGALAQIEDLKRLSGVLGEGVEGSLIKQWAQRDFDAAEEWVRKVDDAARKDALLEALLAGRMSSLRGKEAVDFVLARPGNGPLQHHLSEAFQNWAMSDPESAITQFAAMPDGHPIWREADSLGRAAMLALLLGQRDRDAVLTWAQKLPEGAPRRRFLAGAANNASSNDLAAAERILAHLPESREREDAIGMFTEMKMRSDQVGTAEWLGTLEPSPSRDAAVARFASLLRASDPERAREWAETIGDAEERARILKRWEGSRE